MIAHASGGATPAAARTTLAGTTQTMPSMPQLTVRFDFIINHFF